MPKADNTRITSRRTLLASAALVAPAALLPAIAAAAEKNPSRSAKGFQASDPHLAWHAEWQACLAYMDGPAGGLVDGLDELPEWHRALELEDLMGRAPARTLTGVLVQLRVIIRWQGELSGLTDREKAALANAIATLERLSGEAGHA
jgi:hypothetical protein